MTAPRTNRQDEIFDYIVASVRKNGYAPSIREICQALGLRSTSTVHYHLTALAKRGRDGKRHPRLRRQASNGPQAD